MQIPSLLNDVLFKIVFGNAESAPILISFLNAVLELKGDAQIADITITSPVLEKDDLTDKGCILDVSATDHRQRRFNVEVQIQSQVHFVKRTVFYTAKNYVQQLDSGERYGELNKTYTISLCNFTVFPDEREDVHSRFSPLRHRP